MVPHYQDPILEVHTGIDVPEETPVDDVHELRDLSDSIKIIARSHGAKFLQFVTCLVPNLYSLKYEKKCQWDTDPGRHYMRDLAFPRWKVDVPEDSASCFYDENGAHVRTNEFTAIYDCPGGNALLPEQRFVFCTFVILENHVTHKVKWSRQSDFEKFLFYSVAVQQCNHLPDWAIKSVTEDYAGINRRRFELPRGLAALQNPQARVEELNQQAQEDFLPAPEDWLTRKTFPLLFQSQLVSQLQNSPKF